MTNNNTPSFPVGHGTTNVKPSKLKRTTQEGKIFMTELDELEGLIKEEQSHSKSFYMAGLFVSLTGAPTFGIMKNITNFSPSDIMRYFVDSGNFYVVAFIGFIISLVCMGILWWESRKDKGRALTKISLIKREHGYES